MKKTLSTVSVIGTLYLLPLIAFAQAFQGMGELVASLLGFINNALVPLVFGIAFLVFLYGVFKYFILGGADEKSRTEGKSLVLYAIIGFVLMVSIWGIVNFVAANFGWREVNIGTIPRGPAI